MNKIISTILACIALLSVCNVNANSIRPYSLRCEMQLEPLGIETNEPALSWKLSSPVRNQFQTAYQVLVADSREKLLNNTGNFWNSGKIESSQSLHITYNGKK